MLSRSQMRHFHGECKASEGEYEGGETHVVVEFEAQLLYSPRDEAANDCYDREDGKWDSGFQGHILLTGSEVDVGRRCGHGGGREEGGKNKQKGTQRRIVRVRKFRGTR